MKTIFLLIAIAISNVACSTEPAYTDKEIVNGNSAIIMIEYDDQQDSHIGSIYEYNEFITIQYISTGLSHINLKVLSRDTINRSDINGNSLIAITVKDMDKALNTLYHGYKYGDNYSINTSEYNLTIASTPQQVTSSFVESSKGIAHTVIMYILAIGIILLLIFKD